MCIPAYKYCLAELRLQHKLAFAAKPHTDKYWSYEEVKDLITECENSLGDKKTTMTYYRDRMLCT